jgi:hypothetical protein
VGWESALGSSDLTLQVGFSRSAAMREEGTIGGLAGFGLAPGSGLCTARITARPDILEYLTKSIKLSREPCGEKFTVKLQFAAIGPTLGGPRQRLGTPTSAIMLQDDTPLKHFLGGLLFGGVVVGLIFQITRGTASQQDPTLDPLLDTTDPAVETTDPTLRDDDSASTTDSTYQPLLAFLDKHKTSQLS